MDLDQPRPPCGVVVTVLLGGAAVQPLAMATMCQEEDLPLFPPRSLPQTFEDIYDLPHNHNEHVQIV